MQLAVALKINRGMDKISARDFLEAPKISGDLCLNGTFAPALVA
jgi:hypothetical protein